MFGYFNVGVRPSGQLCLSNQFDLIIVELMTAAVQAGMQLCAAETEFTRCRAISPASSKRFQNQNQRKSFN